MTFRQILATFRRRWLTILVAVVVAVGAAAAYALAVAPTYQSSAVVAVATPSAASGATSPLVLPSPLQEIASAAVQSRAAALLHDAAPTTSASQVSGTVDPTTGALTITATAPSAARAQAVAQAYAQAVVDAYQAVVQGRVDRYSAAITNLTGQIAALQARPGAATDPLVAAQVTGLTSQISALQSAQSNLQFGEPYATIQTPATPGAPTGLSHAKLGAVALLGGLIAGCGIALVRDGLDDRVRDAPDIDAAVAGPLLAQLPQDRDVRSGQVALALVQAPQSPLAESVRDLRTSLRVLLADQVSPVVMVTSPQAGDGKTFVAANLAVSWALTGSKVVVVSADFRRPRLEEVLGVDGADLPGLSDLIDDTWRRRSERASDPEKGETDVPISELLVETGIEGLWLLPVGGHTDNPSELFGSPGIQPVLDQLRAAADIVLLDTPPVLATPDAAILGGLTDGAVLVAAKGKTDRGELERTARRLEATRCTVLGLVLNKVRGGSADLYQPYGYRP